MPNMYLAKQPVCTYIVAECVPLMSGCSLSAEPASPAGKHCHPAKRERYRDCLWQVWAPGGRQGLPRQDVCPGQLQRPASGC